MRTKVYIAGPYSQPDPLTNTEAAMKVWRELWDAGYAPYCPHWTYLQDKFSPMPYETWLQYDKEYLPCCQAILRLPGMSSGADKEIVFATALNIPTYYSIDELLEKLPPNRD